MDNKANPTQFLDLVWIGQIERRHYFLGLALILFFWRVLGASLSMVALRLWAMVDGNPETAVNLETSLVTGVDPIISYIAFSLSFGMLIVGVFVVIRFVHERPFRSLITPWQKMNWRRLGQGFGLWLLLVALASGVEYLLNPDIYTFVLNPRRFIPFAVAVLLLTPMQTTAEELLFRGYLLQATGHLSRNFWLLALINGIIFMAPHLGNPELAADAILLPLYYFSFGLFFAFVTLRDNSAELAIGAHAANNLYAALFANYANSALQTESILLVTELDGLFSLIAFWVTAVIFYTILLGTKIER